MEVHVSREALEVVVGADLAIAEASEEGALEAVLAVDAVVSKMVAIEDHPAALEDLPVAAEEVTARREGATALPGGASEVVAEASSEYRSLS